MKVVRTKIIIKPDSKRVILRPFEMNSERIKKVVTRILSLSDREVNKESKTIYKYFSGRHRELKQFYLNRYEQLKKYLTNDEQINEERKLLIGAYFTNEYSVEAAALFNPSIVWAPDQSRLTKVTKRFILSLRAVGEGHISSIIFTSGIINENNNINLEKRSDFITNPQKINDYLPGNNDLYELEYSREIPLSERIIFPHSASESNGIEDARFVEFYDDNGERTYYATYTAYDGKTIHPQILETKDFLHFKISSLKGREVKNKGIALFPRKINGNYAVGSMRQYTIGAFLLDKDNPSKMIGRLSRPLLTAGKKEREGYVPNVVYSCGAIVNNGELIIPYAMSDYACSFAKVNLKELIAKLKSDY
ncbi:MAG: hypothetical protein P8Z35_14120 [Ignavibacteriaceae bacterium]